MDRNGLVFNTLAGGYFMAIITIGCTCKENLPGSLLRSTHTHEPITFYSLVAIERTRYYQESREAIYSGPTFLLANFVQSLPISLLASFLSAFIIFRYIRHLRAV